MWAQAHHSPLGVGAGSSEGRGDLPQATGPRELASTSQAGQVWELQTAFTRRTHLNRVKA